MRHDKERRGREPISASSTLLPPSLRFPALSQADSLDETIKSGSLVIKCIHLPILSTMSPFDLLDLLRSPFELVPRPNLESSTSTSSLSPPLSHLYEIAPISQPRAGPDPEKSSTLCKDCCDPGSSRRLDIDVRVELPSKGTPFEACRGALPIGCVRRRAIQEEGIGRG